MELTPANKNWPLYTVRADYKGSLSNNEVSVYLYDALLASSERRLALVKIHWEGSAVIVEARSDLSPEGAKEHLLSVVKGAIPGFFSSIAIEVSNFASVTPQAVVEAATNAKEVVTKTVETAKNVVTGVSLFTVALLVGGVVAVVYLVRNADNVAKLVGSVKP